MRLEDEEGKPVGGRGKGNGLGESVVVEKKRKLSVDGELLEPEEGEKEEEVKVTGPAEVGKGVKKRTLYVGNVGDARAVLS